MLDGTARRAILDGYTSAGKTGTAQKIDPRTHAYSKTDYVASFRRLCSGQHSGHHHRRYSGYAQRSAPGRTGLALRSSNGWQSRCWPTTACRMTWSPRTTPAAASWWPRPLSTTPRRRNKTLLPYCRSSPPRQCRLRRQRRPLCRSQCPAHPCLRRHHSICLAICCAAPGAWGARSTRCRSRFHGTIITGPYHA